MPRYSAQLLDHFHAPRNAGELAGATAVGRGTLDGRAPYTTLYLRVEEGRVAQCGFQAFGCGVAIACGSALTELITGRPLDACRTILEDELTAALGRVPPEKAFCAQITLRALQDAIANHDQTTQVNSNG